MQSIILIFMTTASIALFSLPSYAGTIKSGSSNKQSNYTAKQVFPPLGHANLCRKSPSECRVYRGKKRTRNGRVAFSSGNWRQLVSVNSQVNRQIISRTDMKNHRKLDVWSVKGRYGDCEDYALRKRKMLIQKGWPSSSLLITTARDHKGRPHAVLIARTSKGDFVLDNLSNRVRHRNAVPYQWLKQQSSANPRQWVALRSYKRYVSRKNVNAKFRNKREARQYLNSILAKLKKRQRNNEAAGNRYY